MVKMMQRTDYVSQDVAKTLDGLFQVAVLAQPWTVENGLLTPTMKLKRMKVVEAHKPEFESLYAGH